MDIVANAFLQGEEERKQRRLEEKKRQLAKKEATHLHDVILKLEELRALRVQTLELEGIAPLSLAFLILSIGQQVPPTSSLYEILQQYLKDHPLEEVCSHNTRSHTNTSYYRRKKRK